MEDRITHLRQVITVEPIIGGYFLTSYIYSVALANLEYEKTCRANLNLNHTVCEAILSTEEHNFTQESSQITEIIVDMRSWLLYCQRLIPLVIVLFLGSYSDTHKLRKPFLLLPILGDLIGVSGCILSAIFLEQWPLEVEGFLQTVIPLFFGGSMMVSVAAYAYISDVSPPKTRTFRVGIVYIITELCLVIGQVSKEILFDKMGYIGVLALAACLFLSIALYGIFWIQEPKPEDISIKSFFVDAFRPRHAIDTIKLLLKKSPNGRNFMLVLLLTRIFSIVANGEFGVFLDYFQSVQWWDSAEYTNYVIVDAIIFKVGQVLGLYLLARLLRVEDLVVLAWIFFNKIVANLIFALANSFAMFYVGSVVNVLIGISGIGIISVATKIVAPDDTGKALFLVNCADLLGEILGVSTYDKLVETLRLSFARFYVGAFVYAFALLLIVWVYFKNKAREVRGDPDSSSEKIMEDYQMTHL